MARPQLIDSLRALEAQFLLLHSREGILQELTASLRTVFEKKSRLESDYRPAADLVYRLLSPEASLPSLYNCLLAFNMVKFRRLLGLPDLLRGNLGEAVSASEFDCPPEISARIAEYVASSLENLQTLHAQLSELRRLAGYLSYDEQGQADTRLLAALYGPQAGGGPAEPHGAGAAPVHGFRARLPAAARRNRDPGGRRSRRPCSSRPSSRRSSPAWPRSPTSWRRPSSASPTSRSAASWPSAAPAMGAIPKELEVLQLVEEGLAVLFNLGKALARVLAMDGVGAREGEAERPLDASLLQGQPFRLPHAGRRLQAERFPARPDRAGGTGDR